MTFEGATDGQEDKEATVGKLLGEGTEEYTLESGYDVSLTWRAWGPDLLPGEHSVGERIPETLVFLPGLEAHAQDKTTIDLNRVFAEVGKCPSYAITTKSEGPVSKDSTSSSPLFEESRAISRFIKERGLSEVTLIGYSVGGSKAIDIASILQSDPEIHIKGIVLLASVGLYEQKPIELAKNLLSDSFVRTPKNLAQETGKIETFGTWIRVGTDVARNMITETLASPGHIGKLRQGVQEVNSLPKCNRKMS